jgi:hypothetical protein
VQDYQVPVLMMDPEQLKREDDRRFWMDSLSALGGGAVGAGVGSLAVNPYNYFKDRRAEKDAVITRDNFMRNREILETLRDLRTGKVTWDDIEPEAKPQLEQLYQEHEPLLKNRQALGEALSEPPPAEVHFLPGAQRFSWKRVLPNGELLRNFGETIRHPAVTTGALLGGFVAGYAMDRHNHNRFYDMLKQEQGRAGNVILDKEVES